MFLHVDEGSTEVAQKTTSDLLTFSDIDIFYIPATTVVAEGVKGFYIYILTNVVLKNSIWSWSHRGLVQKGLAHLHNTDSGAASILYTLLQMHPFEKCILFPPLHSSTSPPRDPSDLSHAQHPSAELNEPVNERSLNLWLIKVQNTK